MLSRFIGSTLLLPDTDVVVRGSLELYAVNEVFVKSGVRASMARSGHRLTVMARGADCGPTQDAADALAQHDDPNALDVVSLGLSSPWTKRQF